VSEVGGSLPKGLGGWTSFTKEEEGEVPGGPIIPHADAVDPLVTFPPVEE